MLIVPAPEGIANILWEDEKTSAVCCPFWPDGAKIQLTVFNFEH